MPFIHVKIAGPVLPPVDVIRLQQEITAMMAGILRKKAELTSVLVEQVSCSGWSIGGHSVPIAAHLAVWITAQTNTAEEKSQFVAKAHALLKTVAGLDLPVATYVVINELPRENWGYDGLTQAHRAEVVQAVTSDAL